MNVIGRHAEAVRDAMRPRVKLSLHWLAKYAPVSSEGSRHPKKIQNKKCKALTLCTSSTARSSKMVSMSAVLTANKDMRGRKRFFMRYSRAIDGALF